MPEERLFEETLKEAAGFLSNRERSIGFPVERIMELDDLVFGGRYQGQLISPHRRDFLLREALTTSDFPYLFGDVLDRQMLAAYRATDPVWKAFTRMSTVRDFRVNRRIRMDGGDGELDLVTEKGEYLASDRAETNYNIYVRKYGRQFDISWESMINDDLGALKDTPERFARAAVRTEHRFVTGLYYHNVVLATAARGNLSINPLTIANLETGMEWFGARTNTLGDSIPGRAKYLVVPPALEMTARQILTSATKMWLDASTRAGATPQDWAMPTTNVIPQMGLTLIVDPYITILGAAATPLSSVASWFLFTDPKELAVLEAAHLSGHERPEIAMKSSDKVTVGGGLITPLSGDFATDNVFYRVRHIFGGTTLDWRGFYFGGHLD